MKTLVTAFRKKTKDITRLHVLQSLDTIPMNILSSEISVNQILLNCFLLN